MCNLAVKSLTKLLKVFTQDESITLTYDVLGKPTGCYLLKDDPIADRLAGVEVSPGATETTVVVCHS